MNRLPFLAVALLLALPMVPTAFAAANPEVSYLNGPHQGTVDVGTTKEYTVTVTVTPPDGKTKVDLEMGFQDLGSNSFAPATQLLIRSTGPDQTVGTIQGYTQRVTAEDLNDGQYVVTVRTTLQEGQEPGDFSTHLAFVARDPTTQSSSPGVIYSFEFNVPTPPNRAPEADFTFSSSGLKVDFDGSASSDVDFGQTQQLTYTWAFGDGQTANGKTPSHTFAEYEAFTVRLTVTDPGTPGLQDDIEKTVDLSASNHAPTADFTFSSAGRSVSFQGGGAGGSSDPDEGDLLTFLWDFGDGESSTQQAPVHTYATFSQYEVQLTVTDAGGLTDDKSKELDLSANNQAPTASFTTSATGLSVSFDGSASSDPDNTPPTSGLTYFWTFGDGAASSEGPTVSHTYGQAGSYNAQLQVTDSGGLTSPATSHEVTVTAPAPPGDGDGDGDLDNADNCPSVANANQANQDGDAQGDACDGDDDGDSFTDAAEASAGSDPLDSASIPDDRDGDGFSNAAETSAGSSPTVKASTPLDLDGDGRANDADNCSRAANPTQADADGDKVGDACDTVADGPNGDQDNDGRLNGVDNCPAAANANQADGDADSVGDACDSDRDGDGATNPLDAFPDDKAEQLDTDADGEGDNVDADDDGDHIPDAEEAERGLDPKDGTDAPYRPASLFAVPDGKGGALVYFKAEPDERVVRYLIWREASPLVLIASLPSDGEAHRFYDRSAPSTQWRYYVQAQFLDNDLLFRAGDAVVSNDLTPAGPVVVACTPGEPDTDGDGLCDATELRWGLDPAKADSDGDGVDDRAEVFAAVGAFAIPTATDSDGDGRPDDEEIAGGFDPLSADVEKRGGAGLGLGTVLGVVAFVAIVAVLVAVVLGRRKP